LDRWRESLEDKGHNGELFFLLDDLIFFLIISIKYSPNEFFAQITHYFDSSIGHLSIEIFIVFLHVEIGVNCNF